LEAFECGRLNNSSQMSVENINKIIDKYVIKNEIVQTPSNELTEAEIKKLCERHRAKILKTKYNAFVEACLLIYYKRIEQGLSMDNFKGTILGISNQLKFKKAEKVDYETYMSEREID
jgi:hypothetical protein